MPKKKYVISLTPEERQTLCQVIKTGSAPAKEILRANILLNSDSSDGRVPKKVRALAEVLGTTATTVQSVRTQYSKNGIDRVLKRKKRETPPVPAKVDGDLEAHIIALACSEAPDGYARWTLRMLADRSIELGYIDKISHSTVGRILKKTNFGHI